MSNLVAPGPLADEDLDELDRYLLALEGLDDSMDISMLDGFLTAIVCGPRIIMPSEWMRWVWDLENGRQTPEFENRAQAERILGLILRHMNDIATVLSESPAEYEPLLRENANGGDPVPIIDEWCVGFVKGMSLDAAGWSRLPASQRASLADIELYGTESRWNELEEKKLPLERHRAIAHGLATVVRGVHAHSLKERRSRIAAGELPAPSRAEPVRNPGKTGRNEPCPCGSGKKYKRCHGTGMH